MYFDFLRFVGDRWIAAYISPGCRVSNVNRMMTRMEGTWEVQRSNDDLTPPYRKTGC